MLALAQRRDHRRTGASLLLVEAGNVFQLKQSTIVVFRHGMMVLCVVEVLGPRPLPASHHRVSSMVVLFFIIRKIDAMQRYPPLHGPMAFILEQCFCIIL
jgi:hypothetical protein